MRVSGVSCVVLYSGDAGQMRQIGHETHQHCPRLTDQHHLLQCIGTVFYNTREGLKHKKVMEFFIQGPHPHPPIQPSSQNMF